MAKNMFNEETGKFKKNEKIETMKKAIVNAKLSQPRLEVHGKSKTLSNKAFGIGRDKTNQLIIADTKVSRFHAVVSFENDISYIKDTGSSNGTFVNGKTIAPRKKVRLYDGDKIKVGTTVIIFYR